MSTLAQEFNSQLQMRASLMKQFEKSLLLCSPVNGKNGKNGENTGNGSGDAHSTRPRFLLTPPSRNSFESSLPDPVVLALKPKHMRILTLHVTGMFSRPQIASLVNCSLPTITNTINSLKGQEYILDHYEGIKGDFESLATPAVSALREGLHSPDHQLKVRTAVDYFKLIGAQTKKKVEVSGEIIHRAEDVKQKLFNKLGLNPEILIEVEAEQNG